MGNKLREVFNTSPEVTIKSIENILYIVLNAGVPKIKLVKDGWKYHAEPFQGFIGDCEYCDHIYNNHQGVSTGGWCGLHIGEGCGSGFVCKDYAGQYPTNFENPYVSILENELKWVTGNINHVIELRKRVNEHAEV